MGLPADWSAIKSWWSPEILVLPSVANPAKAYKKKCPSIPVLASYKAVLVVLKNKKKFNF
jgi:hypothetical protein